MTGLLSSRKDDIQEVEVAGGYSTGEREISNSDPMDKLSIPPAGSRERSEAEKRLVRKLDTRLLPTIILIYIMNYIDVSNFSSTMAFTKGLADQCCYPSEMA